MYYIGVFIAVVAVLGLVVGIFDPEKIIKKGEATRKAVLKNCAVTFTLGALLMLFFHPAAPVTKPVPVVEYKIVERHVGSGNMLGVRVATDAQSDEEFMQIAKEIEPTVKDYDSVTIRINKKAPAPFGDYVGAIIIANTPKGHVQTGMKQEEHYKIDRKFADGGDTP